MAKKNCPIPRKRYHRGTWEIFWNWQYKRYTLTLGLLGEKDDQLVEPILRQIAAALANADPESAFPDDYANAPGVMRYLEDRFHVGAVSGPNGHLDILTQYKAQHKLEASARWHTASIAHIEALKRHCGADLATVTPAMANDFLATLLANDNKPATRNRALAACRRFFGWVVETRRGTKNPFAGIKALREERRADILYCTEKERAELIAAARDSGRPEWMAIPIAFYAGMRREEISRLDWQDIRFAEGIIVVQRSKTGKSREVPLAAALEDILKAVPESRRVGHGVPVADEVQRLWRMDNLVRHLRKAKQASLLAAWRIERPPPSRAKDYREKKAAFEAEKKKRAALIKAALERIGWNPFRHTYGTLVIQKKIASIDELCSWMGNTPEVCRRHYVQFMPRDQRNREIDRL